MRSLGPFTTQQNEDGTVSVLGYEKTHRQDSRGTKKVIAVCAGPNSGDNAKLMAGSHYLLQACRASLHFVANNNGRAALVDLLQDAIQTVEEA